MACRLRDRLIPTSLPGSLLSAPAAKTAARVSKTAPGASQTAPGTSIRVSQASPQSAPRPKNRAQASPGSPQASFRRAPGPFRAPARAARNHPRRLKARRHRWGMIPVHLALTASRAKTTPQRLNPIDAHMRGRLATASRRGPHKRFRRAITSRSETGNAKSSRMT